MILVSILLKFTEVHMSIHPSRGKKEKKLNQTSVLLNLHKEKKPEVFLLFHFTS